jgi:hypothetical protein
MLVEVVLLQHQELRIRSLVPQLPDLTLHLPLVVEAEQRLLLWMMVMMRLPNLLDGVFKEILCYQCLSHQFHLLQAPSVVSAVVALRWDKCSTLVGKIITPSASYALDAASH